MNHIKALIMKFIMIAIVLSIILTGIFDVEFSDTLLISLVLTVVAYLLGDLMIFRKTGDRDAHDRTGNNDTAGHSNSADHKKRNMMATIGDIVLSFLVIWLMGEMLFAKTDDIIAASLISALAIGAGEWFFHKYLDKNVFPEKDGRAATGNTNH
ncbi:YndM family protein [Planococcus shixiaomingii]|uniref:YndM family protein n=1 Tax=Planococcus shixiaomingii TaxID=3058393 RepID=UPI002618A314|nr:YndM family protein [Planococcus sp. N022]WKA54452.1 YndM family protein [Planococcus sp. N022]